MNMKSDRLDKVLCNMRALGLKQLAISSPASIDYLTGIRVSPGERMLVLYVRDDGECALFANHLFAIDSADGARLILYSDTDDAVAALAEGVKPGILGVDKDWPCRFALRLCDLRPDVKLTLGSAAVDDARMIKTPEELSLMRASSRLNDEAIDRAILSIAPGVTERRVAQAYAEAARELGAQGESFDSLICFGANCAEPHHDTGDAVIAIGDTVILDVGARHNGYCSDMTRTVCFGEPSDEIKRVYDLVARANKAGRAAVRPGVKLKDVDAAARKVIEQAGYGDYFIHRTGHGIGLEVHEFPDVSAVSSAVCAPGMVFSIEPGVYLPGEFGVRIEDLVAVTEDGCETLNDYSKEMRVIKC